MNRNYSRKTLYIIFAALIVSILTLTTAYAALNVSLNVTGQAQVNSAKWDIHFENIRIKYGSVGATKNPIIETPTSVNFSVTLNKPGDFFEFSVDILNKGTIDAMINGINKTPTLSSTQQKYLKYEITYGDGNTINSKQILKPNKLKNIRVLVEYKKDISVSDIPKNPDIIKLGFTLNYSQSDTTAITGPDGIGSEIPKLVRMTKGTINNPQIGDMFCIKDECFYVIESSVDTLTGLAQYNLYTGGFYDGKEGIKKPENYYKYGNEATGIQNPVMIGYNAKSKKYSGTIIFSGESNVYDNSIAKEEVIKYKSILETYNVKIDKAELITKEKLIELGCKSENNSAGTCTNAPEWVYTTSYWTMSKEGEFNVWFINSDNLISNHFYSHNSMHGIRPVITINKNYFN